jgi:hypothetical protein
MTAVRNVVSDLVDRRLWPVALLLVAAAIAIPVLLLKPAASAPPSPVASNSAPALASPSVSLSGPSGGPVIGAVKNPFRQQHVPTAKGSSASSTGLGPASSSGGSGAPSSGGSTSTGSGGGSSPGGSGGSGRSTPAAPGAVLQVRFGLADGPRKTYSVSPGSPLPSPTNPLLVYLGQDKSGKVGGFLVSSDAQPQGDGRCEPDKSICSTLYMKVGDAEFFDVTSPSGTVQYELEVLKVVKS